MLISNKLLVPDLTRCIARNDAIRHGELLDRLSQSHSSQTEQRFASGAAASARFSELKLVGVD
jgi:hypothetical protein